MSNVRRLGDYRDDGPSTQPFPTTGQQGNQVRSQYTSQQGASQPQMMYMGGSNNPNPASPYPEINKVLAPNFNRNTFIFWITIVQIIIFILELIIGQVYENGAFVNGNSMAGPSATTLKIMQGKYLICIQHGEIDRFFTPALLHAGILHIFTNLVSQTMIGYSCELSWGTPLTIFFYCGTTFGGTLLSCVGSPCSISVGASGALLGIIGAYMAWIILNWNNRQLLPQPAQRMCSMVVWLFIIFIIGLSTTGIDNWAHLGGWLSGLLLGFSFCRSTDTLECLQGKAMICRIVSIALTLSYFLSLLFTSFFGISTKMCAPCW